MGSNRELIGLKDNEEVPLYRPGYNVPVDEAYVKKHLPNWNETRRNCQICNTRSGVEAKSFVSCVHVYIVTVMMSGTMQHLMD